VAGEKRMCNIKHNKIATLSVLAFLTLVTLACSRGEGPGNGGGGGNGGPHVITDQDSIAPIVAIYTPASNQVFTSGASINMTGRITDET
jgi:hypothetical protein